LSALQYKFDLNLMIFITEEFKPLPQNGSNLYT